MITFIPLASSSAGNAYLVTAPGAAPLLLEAGIPVKRLRDSLRKHGVSLTDLAGCACSHGHLDHGKAVADLMYNAIDCWMSRGTAIELGVIGSHRLHVLQPGEKQEVSGWGIIPFLLEHDTNEPLGFMVSRDGDRLLFVPDTASIKANFFGVNQIAVECNHITEILELNVAAGRVDRSLADRIRKTHLSLESMIAWLKWLKETDLGLLRKIFLIHLSDTSSDAELMRREVERETGIPTEVC